MTPVLTIVAGFGRGDFRSSRLKIAKSQLLSFFDLLSPGGMRLRRVRCVVGHLHRRQGAGSPQVCQHQSCLNLFGTNPSQSFRHQPKSIFLAPVPPQGFQWFSLLLGSPPRFFQINNKYLKSLKHKSECNYSWWKKLGYNSVIMPHLVSVSVNDSVGSFYEGDSNL